MTEPSINNTEDARDCWWKFATGAKMTSNKKSTILALSLQTLVNIAYLLGDHIDQALQNYDKKWKLFY